MTSKRLEVTGGVDTHGRTHHGAVLDGAGRLLADRQFPATASGYRSLLAWLQEWGQVIAVGVEGTGTYGAGLARYLAEHGVRVVEVDRPNRKTRRFQGKSDPIDAVAELLFGACQLRAFVGQMGPAEDRVPPVDLDAVVATLVRALRPSTP